MSSPVQPVGVWDVCGTFGGRFDFLFLVARHRIIVVLAEEGLHLLVVLLNFGQSLLDILQGDLVVRFVSRARFVLLVSEMLDLLARFLDLAQAQSGRGALEEVAQL